MAAVGIGITLWVGKFSTDEIQDALNPNNFLVAIHLTGNVDGKSWDIQSPFFSEDRYEFRNIAAQGNEIHLQIPVTNRSKYAAKNFRIGLYFRDDDFEVGAPAIKKSFGKEKLFDSDPVIYTWQKERRIEKWIFDGYKWPIDYIESGFVENSPWFEIVKKEGSAHLAVMIRNRYFFFKITDASNTTPDARVIKK